MRGGILSVLALQGGNSFVQLSGGGGFVELLQCGALIVGFELSNICKRLDEQVEATKLLEVQSGICESSSMLPHRFDNIRLFQIRHPIVSSSSNSCGCKHAIE